MSQQVDQKLVEPNCGLGQAIHYMLKHWQPLTLFLRQAGAPLDNNVCECALKMAILHLKNSLSYKTLNGARLGDMFMIVSFIGFLFYNPIACFTGFILGLDPIVSSFQSDIEGRIWLPSEHLLDERVVAVASRHSFGCAQVVVPVESHSGDFLHLG